MMATNQTASLADDIRDIKPPIEIPDGLAWLWWVLAALATMAALFLIWRWWQKRRSQIAFVPPVPAHVRAKQKLDEALALIAQPKPFVVAVSDTARTYLEERFEFRAPERTTEEFLRELSGTDLLAKEQKESLGNFLASCDLVKFAKYEPREPELRELHGAALRLVDETVPQVQNPEASLQETEAKFATETSESKTYQNPRGKTLAIVGIVLQLGPSVWIIAYLVMLFRLLGLAKGLSQSDSGKGFGIIAELYSTMISIYGDALIVVCVGLAAGFIGLILLTISLVSLRYRSEWFFWFLIIYGFLLLGAFPCIGTAIGIFFIVYCFTKRREFLNRS